MRASIDDLKRERWLRARNSGALVWVTRQGQEIPIKDMTDEHIEAALACYEKKAYEDEMRDAAAYSFDPFYDLD